MTSEYVLVIRSSESELLALSKTKDNVLKRITPLIELTRGRKLRSKDGYQFKKNLQLIKSIFQGASVYLDLTTEEKLICEEIDELYDFRNGYQRWREFLSSLRLESCFREITPILITSGDDPDIESNLALQVLELSKQFKRLAYRSDLGDELCYTDIPIIYGKSRDVQLDFIIDCGFVPFPEVHLFKTKVEERIRNIKKLCSANRWKEPQFILSSTSFPNNVQNFGNDDYDIFPMSELELFSRVQEQFPATKFLYSDYGSVNPIRNDIVMARGWIPRIDVPVDKIIFYYRQRRPKGTSAYSGVYTELAQKVTTDKAFPASMDNWGIKQIQLAALGAAPGSRPSFWITVRMNIFIALQVKRFFGVS